MFISLRVAFTIVTITFFCLVLGPVLILTRAWPAWTLIIPFGAFAAAAVAYAAAVLRGGRSRPAQPVVVIPPLVPTVAPRVLDEETRRERVAYCEQRVVPGHDAPAYSLFDESLSEALRFSPSGFSITPMYLLDKAYRILDWNEAFSLAFDRTMDGRAGQSVLEWTYFLDNYEAVLEHGSATFGDPQKLPEIDVEPIEYTNLRYGRIAGTKRAYRMLGDAGTTVAWLVTVEPRFESTAQELQFKQDLIGLMSLDLMWSEYALSYDNLLLNTTIYTELIQTMIGEMTGGPLSPLPDGAWIADLGAGTGNISKALAAQKRGHHVIAMENNRTMLEYLKAKCSMEATPSIDQPGVFAVRQNIASLFGIPDDSIDCAIMNNVLYAIADHKGALREVLRVLKPGGELRISGPHKQSDVDVLFRDIKQDLEAKSAFDGLKPAYERVYAINRMRLASMLQRWTIGELADDLVKLGFSKVLYASESIYHGQSMVLSVRK